MVWPQWFDLEYVSEHLTLSFGQIEVWRPDLSPWWSNLKQVLLSTPTPEIRPQLRAEWQAEGSECTYLVSVLENGLTRQGKIICIFISLPCMKIENKVPKVYNFITEGREAKIKSMLILIKCSLTALVILV